MDTTQLIYDEENNVVIINGRIKYFNKVKGVQDISMIAVPLKLQHSAEKIIQVYIDENNKGRFFYLKNRHGPRGEFTPTKEERNYIFEQLIGI